MAYHTNPQRKRGHGFSPSLMFRVRASSSRVRLTGRGPNLRAPRAQIWTIGAQGAAGRFTR